MIEVTNFSEKFKLGNWYKNNDNIETTNSKTLTDLLDDGPPGVDPEGPESGSVEQEQGRPEDMVVQEGEEQGQGTVPEGLMRKIEQDEVRISLI